MLEAVFNVANHNARIVACSMNSQDHLPQAGPLKNTGNIVLKSIKYEGYVVFNHMDYEEKSLNDATPFFVSGAAKHHMNIVNGIKNVPKELVKAFRDNKKGKQVVHVADL